jgi:tRNA C32,U32 (ribose-2'-O)-methylase TrmJ
MNCRVILARPRIAANIGAAARVMRNMGLSDLVLVAPEADPADERVRRLATHGADVLERLPSHSPERLAELLPDEWAQSQRGAFEAVSERSVCW